MRVVLAEETTKAHVKKHILMKVGVSDHTHTVTTALKCGLIDI